MRGNATGDEDAARRLVGQGEIARDARQQAPEADHRHQRRRVGVEREPADIGRADVEFLRA